ncbi:hypothetical protein [Alkalicoccobacillus porphyridii]|uniref:YncE family protein n=1 Tax=Alkalicoccobacillus porphyridii TaxID=2597270 RepID=A0A553ZYX2_9BACI|nr:hypothetical protein [Alkalicoccobacillus porphyridii]TSB46650.1 hypothetical protein FN960_09850 [Alkalicoccobacillus porphyridii]
MKYARLFPFVMLGWFLMSGCQDQSIEVPETSDELLLVSHAKESSLSFINPQTDEDIASTSIPFTLTDMAFISENKVVGINPNEEQLIEIDLDEQVTRPFMDLGFGMSSIVFDEASERLFVADTQNHRVHVIDANSKDKLASVDMGAAPNELSISQNGDLYIVLSEKNEMIQFDTNSNQVVQTFSINDTPAGIYVDEDVVWVGGHGSNTELNRTVYAFDPQLGGVQKEIEVGLMPIAIEIGDHERDLFVLCHGDHTVYKIDADTGEIDHQTEVGQNPNDIYATDDKLYVTNLDSDTISILNQSDLSLIKTIPVAPGPYLILSEVNS